MNLVKVSVGLGVNSAGCKALLKEIGGKHEALLPFYFFVVVKGSFCDLACLKYFPTPSQPLLSLLANPARLNRGGNVAELGVFPRFSEKRVNICSASQGEAGTDEPLPTWSVLC